MGRMGDLRWDRSGLEGPSASKNFLRGFKLTADPEVTHQRYPKASVEPICNFYQSPDQLYFQSHDNKYPTFTMLWSGSWLGFPTVPPRSQARGGSKYSPCELVGTREAAAFCTSNAQLQVGQLRCAGSIQTPKA